MEQFARKYLGTWQEVIGRMKLMTMMKFCGNIYCETPDEPIERVSDYRIVEGAVVCVHCYELEQDAQEELEANQLDW